MDFKRPPIPAAPNAAQTASDGDIHELYAGYLADYISGPGTSSSRRDFPLINQNQQGGELTWWDLYVQDLKSELQLAKAVGHTAAEVAVQIDERVQFWIDLWNEAIERWDEFLDGRDLDEVTIDGTKLSGKVITLRKAEEVIEQLRLNNLKAFFTAKIAAIRNAIDLIEHPLSTLSPQQQAEDVGGAGQVMIAANQVLDSVQDIGRSVVDLIEKFDIVTQIEHDLEAAALGQTNERHARKDKGVTRKRSR
jgi:hypothetical protein